MSTAPVHVHPATAERILDAAFGCIESVGLARTTVEDVARAAGLSRQSVYRYFPTKDHLIMGLVLREEERFLDGIRMAFERDTDLRQAIEDSLLFCLRFARQHPLLDRLLQTDPGTLLPYLTTRS
ncbi:MAG TPA: TetR family transcriptional regulator, partial [Candidatus Limnocylindrales bacterium]